MNLPKAYDHIVYHMNYLQLNYNTNYGIGKARLCYYYITLLIKKEGLK